MLFTLLSILSLRFHCVLAAVLHKVSVLHDFSTNESFLKISMNDTGSLGSFSVSSYGPASHLVLTCSEEVN
jgi:hypothetical protein